LSTSPILKAPHWEKEFHVHTNASTYVIGSVLTQPGELRSDYPIYFATRQLDATERNYTTMEREGLAGKSFQILYRSSSLLYLVNKSCIVGRITNWSLLLQEFDFEIVVRKGKQHYMADHMSIIKNGEIPMGVNDELLDAILLKVDFAPNCYDGII